jgi:hypothetical protein
MLKMTTGRILAYAAIVLAVWGTAGSAVAQFRVGDDGSALDANNRLGSGGFNTRRLAPVNVTADQIVTGNVTGGRAFRGTLQTGDQSQFRGTLGTDTSDRFIRDSAGAPRRGQAVVPASAYIIRNGRLDAQWAAVDRRAMSIAGRAIATMIASSGYNDVVRIWNTALRDGIDYNLAFIPRDFTVTYTEPFEQAYMRALFDFGYQRARRGYDWAKQPPGGS